MATISWNINGIFTHLPELQIITAKYQPDYICLQETHLDLNKTLNFKGHTIYRKDRDHNNYGGVAILVKQSNHSTEINIQTDLEAVAVRVLYPEPCTICSNYIPPE